MSWLISRRDDDKANLLTHNWTTQLDISTGVCGISTSLAAIIVYNGELPLSHVYLLATWAWNERMILETRKHVNKWGLLLLYIIVFTLDNNVGGVQLIFKGAHHNTPLSSQLYSSLYIYIYNTRERPFWNPKVPFCVFLFWKRILQQKPYYKTQNFVVWPRLHVVP